MRLPYTVEEGCFCHKIFTLEKLDIQFCQARLNRAMGTVVLLIKKRKINFIANQSIRGNVLISTPEHVHVISFLRPWPWLVANSCKGCLLPQPPLDLAELVKKRESRIPNSNAAAPHKESLCASLQKALMMIHSRSDKIYFPLFKYVFVPFRIKAHLTRVLKGFKGF